VSGGALDVTVVVPAYQSARWIGAALASLRAQTLAPREIVVVDNGSTDDTAALAAAAGATVLVRPGGGPSRARNAGIAAARTEWIAFCDADDLWEPNKLARHADAARLCPDAGFTFSDWLAFDERGPVREIALCDDPVYRRLPRRTVGPGIVRFAPADVSAGFYRSMFVLTSTALVRRDVLAAAGPFDERLRIAEDYDLFLRVLARGGAAAIEERLVRYRRHPSSISRDEVVNTAAHRTLWALIEAAPERYPPGGLDFVRRDRVRRAAVAGEFAARRGRFGEARRHLGESLRLRFTSRAALWYAFSLACDTPLAARARRSARRTNGPVRPNGGLPPGADGRSYDEPERRLPTAT
jgi:glycosyltransferase involved in cell wall biosynthesis